MFRFVFLSSLNVFFPVTKSLITLLFRYLQTHHYFVDLSQHVMTVRMITMVFDVNAKRVRLGKLRGTRFQVVKSCDVQS